MATRARTQQSTSQSDSEEVNVNEQQEKQSRAVQRRCRFCKRNFTKTEHLVRHERSHTKEKPFSCTRCSKVYSRRRVSFPYDHDSNAEDVTSDTLLRHWKVHEDGREKSDDEQLARAAVDSPESMECLQHNQHLPAGKVQTSMDITGSHFEIPGDFPNIQMNLESESFSSPGNHSSAATTGHLAPDSVDDAPYQPKLVISSTNNVFPNNFPIGMIDPNDMSQFAGGNLLGGSLTSPGPAWLVGYDFDLNALNTSVSAQIDLTEPLFQPQVSLAIPEEMNLMGLDKEPQFQSPQRPLLDNVRKSWFTYIEGEDHLKDNRTGTETGAITPAISGDHYDVDDTFRARVSLKLKPRTNDDPLPSTKYLNLSLQIYFAKFNPIFPVIHSQTFRPIHQNSLLLLSICSIGSLLIGSKGAVAQGVRIFERLNKAILSSWETAILKDPAEAISMIQAALVGQTFGLLSGDPKHLAVVEAFHGTVISWARRSQIFNHRHKNLDIQNLSGAALANAWKKWSRSEQIIRTVLGLYIHDAKLASIFHHEPLLRHDGIATSVAASDAVFNAPTAVAWRDLLKRQLNPEVVVHTCLHSNLECHSYSQPLPNELLLKQSEFTAYVVLHGLVANICEKQQLGLLDLDSCASDIYINALMCWYFTFEPSPPGRALSHQGPTDAFCLMILWHTAFMNLFANFDILERAIGRDGLYAAHHTSPQYIEDTLYASNWASSASAQRCILHAHAIQNALGTMRLDAEPAIHIPHCLFLAGIASYCYTRFRKSPASVTDPLSVNPQGWQAPQVSNSRDQNLDFVEFSLRGVKIPSHLFSSPKPSGPEFTAAGRHGSTREDQFHAVTEAAAPKSRPFIPVGAGILLTLTDILQRIGHWGIARKFAGILETLVHMESDDDWLLT